MIERWWSIHAKRNQHLRPRSYCDLHAPFDPQMTVQPRLFRLIQGDEVEGVVAAAFPQIKEVLRHIEPDTAAERAEG